MGDGFQRGASHSFVTRSSSAVLGCMVATTKALLRAGKKSPTPSAKQERPKLASTGPAGNTGPAADKTSTVCTVWMWKKLRTQISRRGASELCCAHVKVSPGGQTYINITTLLSRWVDAIPNRICDGNAS